jgi:hypothetical protein
MVLSEQLFHDKTVLVLDISSFIGWQSCLTLALEGYHLIGLGPDAEELSKLKREVDDIKGSFEYFVVDKAGNNQLSKMVNDIFDKFKGVSFIINPLGIDFLASKFAVAFYQFYLTEYTNRRQNGEAVCKLEHYIEMTVADADIGTTEPMPFSPGMFKEDEVRFSRLYLAKDTTTATEKDRVWPINGVANISPGLIAAEVLNLLTNESYKQCNAVSLRISGQDVLARLHSIDQDGKVNLNEAVKEFNGGKVLKVYIKLTALGRGVFARTNFRKGELIIKTSGQAIDHQTEHSLQTDWNRHFEPEFPARLINHACEPNLGVRTNALGIPDFIAFRDIKADEALTFDYAMTEYTHYTRDDPDMEFSLSCRCEARSCRGKLGYYSELPAEIKKKYEGFVSAYLVGV